MNPHRVWLALASVPACLAMTPIETTPASPPPPPPVAFNPPVVAPLATNAPLVKGARSGKKQLIFSYYAVNPDCSLVAYPDLSVLDPPKHGQIFIEKGELYPSFPKENVRSVCNAQKVPGVLVYYQSEDGFMGRDDLSLRILSTGGDIKKIDVTVTVF